MDVPVPDASSSFYEEMNKRIDRVFVLREEAFRLTREAEGLYANSFPVTELADKTGFTIRSAQMFDSRRLDGNHFNPNAAAVLTSLQSVPTVSLSKVTARIFGVPRFKHVYQDKGIAYLDSEDLFKLNPEISKFIQHVTKKDAALYYVE